VLIMINERLWLEADDVKALVVRAPKMIGMDASVLLSHGTGQVEIDVEGGEEAAIALAKDIVEKVAKATVDWVPPRGAPYFEEVLGTEQV
jgi:hypothetical protein